MNLENFHDFLKEPSNLHRVSYAELKSMVAEYPYSANLRLLMLLKSKLEKNQDLGRNMQLAATYVGDRAVLFELLHNPKLLTALEEGVLETEDFLELKDLTEVQAILENEGEAIKDEEIALQKPIPSAPKEENWTKGLFDGVDEVAAVGVPAVITIDQLLNTVSDDNEVEGDASTEIDNIVEEEAKTDEEAIRPNQLLFDFVASNLSGFAGVMENFEVKKILVPLIVEPQPIRKKIIRKTIVAAPKKAEPQPKNSFASWLTQFENDLNRELETPDINNHIEEVKSKSVSKELDIEKKLYKKNKDQEEKLKPKKRVKEEIKQSLKLKDEIVSETLAKLLVKQERYDKAIEMYQKLSLKYPERAEIFEAQIEKLKTL